MTSNYWPIPHIPSSCNVPAILAKSSESFQQFYLARHTGRQLTWQYGFGHADVHTQFRKGSHDLNVSTYALIILLLFQDLGDDDFLTYPVSYLICMTETHLDLTMDRKFKQPLPL